MFGINEEILQKYAQINCYYSNENGIMLLNSDLVKNTVRKTG